MAGGSSRRSWGRDGIGSVVVVDKVGGALQRRSEVPCGFLLMRGTSSTPPATC
jgi:hypothetical protein